jgi:hypothetical protein
MWATTVADPYTSFDENDWTQIPFKPKFRAGEVENIGGSGTSLPSQSGQTGKVEHHYVYRGAFDGKVWGTKINKIGANQTEDFSTEITFQDTWYSINFKVINVIYNLVNGKYVFVNANSTK